VNVSHVVCCDFEVDAESPEEAEQKVLAGELMMMLYDDWCIVACVPSTHLPGTVFSLREWRYTL